MPTRSWKSLRSRILLLAVLTLLFLSGAAFTFFAFLRSSQAATLSAAERHLVIVASGLARSYTERPETLPSLNSIDQVKPRKPPPPAPYALDGPDEEPPMPPPPRPALQNAPLAQLTAQALQHESGIEGGLYAARHDALTGYAFPTHEGPGPNKEMPQRERPTIEKIVRDAVSSKSIATTRFEGAHDAILFIAVPVRENTHSLEISGAVWLMQRIPGITGGRNRQLLWGSIGFGSAALITALLTFFVTGEVRRGVNAVLARLSALESGLFAAPETAPAASQLEEFDRVLRGIDTLAASLHQKIEKERTLESEIRHRERLSALGQFAAGIAHELRNPLATIRLRTQMSERTRDLEGLGRNTKVVLEEIDRLDTIISRLLYFARPIHLDTQQASLDELCLITANTWNARQGVEGVHVLCEAASGATILCDRSRMLQVLDNLVENAVHAAGAQSGGRVVITASSDGMSAQVEISDNGAGLNVEALRHALDPFFTTKDSGTGLGLSISFEIVQAHGGELTLSNHPGGGAVALIRLPQPASQYVSPGELQPQEKRMNG